MAASMFMEKEHTFYTFSILELHIRLNGRHGACELGCDLRSGAEESSLDLDNRCQYYANGRTANSSCQR